MKRVVLSPIRGAGMQAKIPVVVLLLKERADSLRRCVEILQEGRQVSHSGDALHQARVMIHDLLGGEGMRHSNYPPAMALEWALEWAYSNPPPPADALREARAVLESAALAWTESCEKLSAASDHAIGPRDRTCPACHVESARMAASEQRRIELVLRESWPVGPEKDELLRLEQMKAGQSLGLDEAFALAAGVDAEGWAAKVRTHEARRGG